MNAKQSLYGLVPKACEELLLSIGYQPKKHIRKDLAPLIARPQDYAAGIIDFAGESMTGSVVFLSDVQFFASCLPPAGAGMRSTPGSAADWLRVRDLSMELTNQLLGRIKNQLYKLGIVVESVLPRAVTNQAIRVVVREQRQAPLVYLAGSHEVFVWFDATTKDDVEPRLVADLITEGDFVEF